MNRRDFIQLSKRLGLALPFSGWPVAGARLAEKTEAIGTVTVVGAGAAGLTTAYLLKQLGVPFEILEAAPHHGGRMKRTTGFADFPVPLGAEWIHLSPDILSEIVNDKTVSVEVPTTRYDPSVDYAVFNGLRVSMQDAGLGIESKFIGSTWFDFYEQYIVPAVAEHIRYNAVVEAIDYTKRPVSITTQDGVYRSSNVVVTVPVKQLQRGAVRFTPPLPAAKQRAIAAVRVWDGCKAFVQFKTPFYPAATVFELLPESAGQKLYYDAAYGQNSPQHVLGLFAVGRGTLPYVELEDSALIAYMLDELDELFDGQATPNYLRHTFQNWNTEPFINGAYVVDHEHWRTVRALGKRVGDRLFFAGCAYTLGEDWSSVHTAARSARRAVEELLEGGA